MAGFRRDAGGINFVTVFVVLVVAAIGYFAWLYIPLWVDYAAVKKHVRTACNKAYSERTEKVVYDTIVLGVRGEGMMDEEIALDGAVMKTPMPFDTQNIQVTLQKEPPSVTAEVAWERKIVWPLFKKPEIKQYRYAHTEDLSPVKY